jgi:hypothetical protein
MIDARVPCGRARHIRTEMTRPSFLAGLVVGIGLAGCQLGVDYDDSSFRCVATTECDDGYACVDGACVAGGDDGGDDDGFVPACGSAAYLSDDFGQASLPQWELTSVGDIDVFGEGGELVFAPGSSDPDVYGEAFVDRAYDLREGRVEVAIAQATSGKMALRAADSIDETVAEIQIDGDALVLSLGEADDGEPPSVPYDAEAHRHLRLRGTGGTLFWETSPDRASWTIQREEAMPEALGYATIALRGYGVADPAEEEARFDDLNPVVRQPTWCSPAEFDDDFADFDARWEPISQDGCVVAVTGGNTRFAVDGTTRWCRMVARRPVDARGVTVAVHVSDVGTADVYLGLITATEEIELQGNADFQALRDNELVVPDVALSPIVYTWWRLRTGADTVAYEVSDDGTTWTELATIVDVPGLAESRLEFGAGGTTTGSISLVDAIVSAPAE